MGRKAGHLALGIGISAGATLTIIPEEVGEEKIPLSALVDVITGSIIKRLVSDRPYGVVVLAEGLAEKLDPASIPELQSAERDPHGHIRYVELDFAGIVKRAVRARLNELLLSKIIVVEKNVGYELRCVPPNSFDREYTRMLGFGVVDFLLGGGSGAMISRQRDDLVPIPFSELVDPATGRFKVRFVEMKSSVYRVASKYMIRLNEADLRAESFAGAAARCIGRSADDFRREFAAAAKWGKVA
jgi:6-phosphofructokinase 1